MTLWPGSEMLGKKVIVTVDRPLGSLHPRYPDIRYTCNYGYVEGIMALDGCEQDAYIIGIDHPLAAFEGVVIAIIHRKNDVEDKWVVAPEGKRFTREEIRECVWFVEQYFVTEFEFLY
jgi:inorganic pyrophosphatase